MQFIRIITQEAHHAAFNMALDEAVSEAVRQKLSPPTLRLYQWDRPSVTIGYFQKISEINIGHCDQKGYPVVRRATGGRAILHDLELTYSFSSSVDFPLFNGGLHENYAVISKALVSGLKLCGIGAQISFERKRSGIHRDPACFKSVSYGEVTAGGRKVIGSAQKRYSNGFLQQGSIMMGFDAGELKNVLNAVNDEGFNGTGPVNDSVSGISVNDLKRSLKEAFENELNVKLVSDSPTKYELGLAKEFEVKKYSAREWNFRR